MKVRFKKPWADIFKAQSRELPISLIRHGQIGSYSSEVGLLVGMHNRYYICRVGGKPSDDEDQANVPSGYLQFGFLAKDIESIEPGFLKNFN